MYYILKKSPKLSKPRTAMVAVTENLLNINIMHVGGVGASESKSGEARAGTKSSQTRQRQTGVQGALKLIVNSCLIHIR